MRKHRAIRLRAKINEEVRVEGEAALCRVHINLEQVGAVLGHVGVELLVPRGEEGVGGVQALAVQAAQQGTAWVEGLNDNQGDIRQADIAIES